MAVLPYPPVIAETHAHTISSMHAFSTLYENVRATAKLGYRFLCTTDHGPAMPGGPHIWYFDNLHKEVPDVLDNVVVLKGVEADIMDFEGTLDIDDDILEKLDWVIASYHTPCCAPTSVEAHTRGWLNIAQNPLVDVIGHSGDGRYAFEHERVIAEFSKYDKIVEINAHSFTARPNSAENCLAIAKLCKQYGVRVVVSTDAHFFTSIGQCGPSLEMLQSIDFPEQLILNTNFERFLAVAREKSGRCLID